VRPEIHAFSVVDPAEKTLGGVIGHKVVSIKVAYKLYMGVKYSPQ